jgi:hypothetical protein
MNMKANMLEFGLRNLRGGRHPTLLSKCIFRFTDLGNSLVLACLTAFWSTVCPLTYWRAAVFWPCKSSIIISSLIVSWNEWLDEILAVFCEWNLCEKMLYPCWNHVAVRRRQFQEPCSHILNITQNTMFKPFPASLVYMYITKWPPYTFPQYEGSSEQRVYVFYQRPQFLWLSQFWRTQPS